MQPGFEGNLSNTWLSVGFPALIGNCRSVFLGPATGRAVWHDGKHPTIAQLVQRVLTNESEVVVFAANEKQTNHS